MACEETGAKLRGGGSRGGKDGRTLNASLEFLNREERQRALRERRAGTGTDTEASKTSIHSPEGRRAHRRH